MIEIINIKFNKIVSEIASHTRKEIEKSDGKLTNYISTRETREICELYLDGFTLEEIAEISIYPNFSDDGGLESERVYMKQYLQKFIGTNSPNKLF